MSGREIIGPDAVIGDLGCSGVDLDEWRSHNRVRLYPGKINHWIVARTLKDTPTPDDVKQTLYAVMNKWFKGSPIDPSIELEDGGRAGATDGISVVAASKERLSVPNQTQLRSALTYPPIPTITAKAPVVYIHVRFNYRGLAESLPWPVRTSPGWAGVQLASSAECPIDADWMLISAGKATEKAPPKKTVPEAMHKGAAEVAEKSGEVIMNIVGTPLIVAGVAFGLYAAWKVTK